MNETLDLIDLTFGVSRSSWLELELRFNIEIWVKVFCNRYLSHSRKSCTLLKMWWKATPQERWKECQLEDRGKGEREILNNIIDH